MATTTTYLGIDPGASGGIAALNADGSVLMVTPMPATDRDILDVLEGVSFSARAVLESVHAMPRQGVVSTFKFGASFGRLQMALAAVRIPFELVRPVKWQTAMQCRTKGDKNVSKRRAQQLFPATKHITHAVADALLLAEYGRRYRNVEDK